MKLGPVLTYKDIDEAKRLLGKKVVFSDNLNLIENDSHCKNESHQNSVLTHISDDNSRPFVDSIGIKNQFIREVIEDDPEEPRYKPYDLSDPAVRKSLRGRWYKRVDRNDFERAIDTFYCNDGRWTVNAYDAEYFLKYFNWLDGTPCGQLVHAGEGHVEGNASVRGIDG